MLDYQRIVDDVRSSLYASGPGAADTIRMSTADYSLACDEVNLRLRHCGELLKAGLRTQAIQQSEIEPNLLDVVSTLDFPERDYWTQLCAQYGVSVPPPLMMDVAADLNEAYAVEQPMETLLARHRLLALAHSPLKMRIKTMRELAQVDTDNPIWREDLMVFERERQKEIQREAKDAANAGDVVAVVKLDKELQRCEWVESPAPTLTHWLAELRQRLVDKHAREELGRIEQELSRASSTGDVEHARELADHWSEIATSLNLPESDPLWNRVAPAFQWLKNDDERARHQQEHDTAVSELQGALDDNKPPMVLERFYHAAFCDGFEIPAALNTRYRTHIAKFESAARRRKMAIMAGVSFIVLFVTAAIVTFTIRQLHQSEIEKHAAALGKLESEGKWIEAQQYVTRLKSASSNVLTAPEIVDLMTRLEGILQNESDRRHAFELSLKTARESAEEAKDWKTLTPAQNALAEARHLAKTDTEKAEVKEIEKRLKSLERDIQTRDDDRFTSGLVDIQNALLQLESNASLSLDLRTESSSNLRKQIQTLKTSNLKVTPALLQQADSLLARLATIDEAAQIEQQSNNDLNKVSTAVGNVESYRSALMDFAKLHPQSSHSADFRLVAEEAPLWAGVAKYNQLAANWKRKDFQAIDPKMAKEMFDTAKSILGSLPDYPGVEAFRERMAYLEAVARRVDGTGESIQTKLVNQFNQPWMVGVWMLEMHGGSRYYLQSKPEFRDVARAFKYVADFDMSQKTGSAKSADVASLDRAPQVTLATNALSLLQKIDEGVTEPRWEGSFCDLMQAICDDQQTDALLRVILLQQVIEIGRQGSSCLEVAFEPHRKYLNNAKLNMFANWLDPTDPEGKAARERARWTLEHLPDLKSARDKAINLWRSLSRPVGVVRTWIGWLGKDSAGQWQCRLTGKVKSAGDLVVVYRNLTNNQVNFDRIAECQLDKIEMLPGASNQALKEGRPIYLIESSRN